ncbi:MAG: hypothetical protein A2504_06455 [Bdellovibrionales bacterium RIFOXYD12_FULL_39_22]|nr:MAG: hypothetical protein A2385_08775 [Bdellovibrionales bacterium RIFOXYB1_FULL_39_21]OFZ45204.1 MAG: hypothetical protein A2485_05755 [Bdellovibrionales bacterium RIFOXYC12_FULL_39_17]OFZ45603.1 MAG: hypothetical protein A2404_03355 [Bdellovibrionales bacterium RIFOXYC1_FULL_39_130]OFZ77465.1 MAG: hypothetical protein A2560_08945 [Bdellovibrionales bacterium RIFOXYD1_FULL_39_84]OFZ91594.1 MAG: hypothetical protein A2504_06455 [Bdellovibrionales bacterium RIFOXYD12_FULL_39_22]HLE11945.1 DN
MGEYKIQNLITRNFRNLHPVNINFSERINCIFGDNGNGKTNILEAIYFLINKKSFRKNNAFPQILSIDSEKSQIIISALFSKNNSEKISVSVKMECEENLWSINGKVKKTDEEIGVVFVNPFDSYNFYNQSSFRRNWFDANISQLNTEYKNGLKRYQKALKFRNILLAKRPNKLVEQIAAIDVEIGILSEMICKKRVDFIKDLNLHLNDIFKKIFAEEYKIELSLNSKFMSLSSNQITKKMGENLSKELKNGRTISGIHLDDYIILFNQMNSYEYCSLGQQKMSYLGLLFAYIELFRYKYGSYPIVLIDDISGELDRYRWSRFIKFLEKGKFQVLITTANENFKDELDKIIGVNKIFIKSGQVCN